MVDESTFLREVQAMERTLYRVSRSLLPTWADCADAVQEALRKAWEKRDRVEPGYFRPWLTRIVVNECRNIQRQRRRVIPVAEFPLEKSLPPPDPSLKEAIFALPEKLRLPLLLHYLEGFSVDEVARMLRLPSGTVKWRLSKARESLRLAWTTEEVQG